MIYGALEAGGTKMICAICKENGEIIEQCSIPTVSPDETIPAIIAYFKDKGIAALGIACFGPIDLHKSSPTYGYITSTPKVKWQNYPILPVIQKALSVPCGFDTDVNGSLLGEVAYGASRGIENAVYITIGTGIGGGVLSNGKLLHGMLHPELGHMTMVPHERDHFQGICPFHKNCLEGMASGPAMEVRYGKKADTLSEIPMVWEMEAYYIGQALCNIILTLSPERIILGGGVMHQEQLFPLIRAEVKKQLNGYLQTEELNDIDHYIVPASLNDKQGVLGCLQLAINAKKRTVKTMKELEKKLISTYGNGIKWLAIGLFTGGVVGTVSAYFAKGIQIVGGLRAANPKLIGLLPLAGLIIVLSYRLFSVKNPKGTNLVLESIQNGETLPSYMAPLIVFATLISHFFGASVGREGAALQLGSSMGSTIGKFLHIKEQERRRMMMCGMSAAFSGLFGTPLAAAVLSMEICTVGHMYYTALLPCTISALVAHFFAEKVVMVSEPELSLSMVSEITWKSALACIALAIIASLVSILFIVTAHKVKAIFAKYVQNNYIRIFLSGSIIVLATLLLGNTDYNGTGMEIIVKTISEPGYKVFALAFLLKILFTAVSLGGGYQGGEIVPSLFIGATLGNALVAFLPLEPGLCAALGMASVFCAVTNCPLATLLICFELFGFQASSYFILAIAISYLCSGNYGLYHTQKILFSKTEEKEINELAH